MNTPNPTARSMQWQAPFKVKSFRFQWSADLATSWAFEMESIVLGWFILVESGSVMLLVIFASLQYMGSLFSPLFGVVGDRIGYRRMLYLSRALYAVMALTLMVLASNNALTPVSVLLVGAFVGLVRPSDMMMRNALIAQTLPPQHLLGALGVSRMTSDTARIAGSLAGAGVVASLGMVWAYLVITLLYTASFILSRGVAGKDKIVDAPTQSIASKIHISPLQDLAQAFHYVWQRPVLKAAMVLAFLVNLLAFPFALGLLPYAAKNIYLTDQAGLGWLGASFAFGGLVGSLILSSGCIPLRSAQTMVIASVIWFVIGGFFAFNTQMIWGIVLLGLAGLAQNFCLTPLAAVMLRVTEPAYRGRVMGMRILAIWGLPIGLLTSGWLIKAIGFPTTTLIYSILGLILTVWLAIYSRQHIWHNQAPANTPL